MTSHLASTCILLFASSFLAYSCSAYTTSCGGNDTIGLPCTLHEISESTNDILRVAATELDHVTSSITLETNRTNDVPVVCASFDSLYQHSCSNVKISTSMNDVPQVLETTDLGVPVSLSTAPEKSCKKQNRRVLRDVLKSTLQVSKLIYQVARLRKIVKHDEKTKSYFNNTGLIYPTKSTNSVSSGHGFDKPSLKHEITAKDIKTFIEDNKDLLTTLSNGDIAFKDPSKKEKAKNQREEDKKQEKLDDWVKLFNELEETYDADIVEFDDQFSNSELVFSIIVNRSLKRVCVVFRGSVTLNDWFIDGLGFVFKRLFEFSETKNVNDDFDTEKSKVHGGFYKYLFEELSSTTEGENATKYDKIVSVLKEIYLYKDDEGRDYSDYELFITGHSLGGGLGQILAFTLAGGGLKDTDLSFLPKGKPITTVTYASPEAGDAVFRKEFTKLEKHNKLRHIRVSNHGDVVPFVSKSFAYKQTGLNIHIPNKDNDKSIVVGYNTAVVFRPKPFELMKMHGLATYYDSLFIDKNERLLSRDVEEYYKIFADVVTC